MAVHEYDPAAMSDLQRKLPAIVEPLVPPEGHITIERVYQVLRRHDRDASMELLETALRDLPESAGRMQRLGNVVVELAPGGLRGPHYIFRRG